MSKVSCYLFTEIPGVWSRWTLAVFATSLADAREYMRIHHRGGKYAGEVTGGKVDASCGATTEKAEMAIREKATQ